MEITKEDLRNSLIDLSGDFSKLSIGDALPDSLGNACAQISLALSKLNWGLFNASFIENDYKFARLTEKLKEVGDEANEVNQLIDEVTQAVKEAREIVQQGTEILEKATKSAKEIKAQYENAMKEADRILKIFGIDID